MEKGLNTGNKAGQEVSANAPFFRTRTGRIVLVIGFIVLALALFGWYWYKRGKNKVSQAKLPANDNAGTNEPDSALSALAAQLYNDMSGISWFTNHNEDIFNNALALSNYDFSRLYNIYNLQYQQSSGKTLTQMVQSCWSIPDTPWASTKAAMLQKLGANNLNP